MGLPSKADGRLFVSAYDLLADVMNDLCPVDVLSLVSRGNFAVCLVKQFDTRLGQLIPVVCSSINAHFVLHRTTRSPTVISLVYELTLHCVPGTSTEHDVLQPVATACCSVSCPHRRALHAFKYCSLALVPMQLS